MIAPPSNAPRPVPRNGYAGDRQRDGLGSVRKIDVPPPARGLSTLTGIDYEDAFLVNVGGSRNRTAEEWARAIFDDSPNALRMRLWSVWILLGLRLAWPGSPRHVLGWEIRKNAADFILLGARSRIGMPAELLVKREGDAVLFDTFVQQRNPLARAVWAGTETPHRAVVPSILKQFGRRVRSQEGDR